MALPRMIKSLVTAALVSTWLLFLLFQYSSWSPHTLYSSLKPVANPDGPFIPKKIWYKVGPQGINNETQDWINTCLNQNPDYDHEILTDSAADAYVAAKFIKTRPDIVNTYLALPIPILKADLLRYLILWVDGGLWSDLDVSCGETPIQDWIPAQYKQNASLVVGWEFDTVDEKHMREFTTWMIMASPNSRHMRVVIDDVLSKLHSKAREHNVGIDGLTMDIIGDVVHVTGPMAMSISIIKSLGIAKLDLNYGKTNYSLMPKIFEDVLILPGYSFSASLQSYREGEEVGPALVEHHFAGSWKNEKGGEAGDPV